MSSGTWAASVGDELVTRSLHQLPIGLTVQRAPEDRRVRPVRVLMAQQRKQRLAAVVVTLVAARPGGATAEQQPAISGVQHRLTRRLGAEAVRLETMQIANDSDVGNARGGPPELGLL